MLMHCSYFLRSKGGGSRLQSAFLMAKQAVPVPVFWCARTEHRKHLKQLEHLNNVRVSLFSSPGCARNVAGSF